ncbi:Spc98 family-domain-containing protein [Russula compacta]|nr:Spc98 family-domain-containing protein [Russula compacta]
MPTSPSSALSRPLYSESSRPTSSASSHRPSSRATTRPLSSASNRPTSRTGHGVPSKFSQRLPSRQMSRITSYDEESDFRAWADIVIRSLDYNAKAAPSCSMNDITKQLHGRTERARINSQDPWADALEHSFSLLKSKIEKIHVIDSEITPAHLPDHLMFLVTQISHVPPTLSAVEHAEDYLESNRAPRVDHVSISWKNILDEEPFEGQHWEGVYGLPPGSTVEGWETRSPDSTPPYSPLPLDDLRDVSPSLSPIESLPTVEVKPSLGQGADSAHMATMSTFGHRQLIEDLQRRQYWRTEWQTDASLTSSLATYIHEHDAVREILIACQGYKNSFLRWAQSDNGSFSFEPSLDAPRIIHLTKGSQLSITQSFAQIASTVEHLRRFVNCVSGRTAKLNSRFIIGHSRRVTRTVEAFSEAVENQIGLFNSWCATRERDIILSLAGNGPPLTTVRDSFSRTFDVLLEVLRKVMSRASGSQDMNMEVWMLLDLPIRFSPFTMSTLLLDTLLTAADGNSSNGDTETSKALMRVFAASAEPMWTMIGLWLKHGMPTQDPALRQDGDSLTALDDEFFIQDNGLSILDPDFWTEGFSIREANPDAHASQSTPLLLDLIANHVLRAGKAVGLLRILDLPLTSDATPEPKWMTDWPTFTALLHEHHATALVETSKEHLARFVHDIILPRCQLPQKRLAQSATSDCDLWLHLTAIEELYFMRKGDAISYFSDILFAKMESGQTWNDFHFLNNTFRDTLKKCTINKMEPTLVRFSYSGSRDMALRGTVYALDDLLVEYAMPFPLTYIFGLHPSSVYRSVFIFLLQIRRAKNVLEGGRMRDIANRQQSKGYANKIIFAMRSRLIWLINTLLNFITTHVIHRQLLGFHSSLKRAESLDEIISLHNSHLQNLESECLLQSNMTALRRAILSILDMTLRFRDALTADVGGTPTIAQSSARTVPRLHRNRREHEGRRGVIAVTMTSREATQASDSESDLEEEEAMGHGPSGSHHYPMPPRSRDGQQLLSDIYEMQDELDKLVRFVHREFEGLADSTSETASAFSVLSFALEDWGR